MLEGENLSLPYKLFADDAAALGFSNLGQHTDIRTVPMIISRSDSIYFSYGFELARLFLGYEPVGMYQHNKIILKDPSDKTLSISLNENGHIRLNHFGDVTKVNTIGLVDLLQNYENAIHTFQFKDKLVLISVTAPGIANLRSTPYTQLLPASFIHATIAENIIQNNYLKDLPVYINWLTIAIIVFAVMFISKLKKLFNVITNSLLVIFAIGIFAMILFIHFNRVLPLAYPFIAFITSAGIFGIFKTILHRSETDTMRQLLEEQISVKEAQLKEAKQRSREMQEQLRQESDVTEKLEQVAEARRQSILELEKEFKDLQS